MGIEEPVEEQAEEGVDFEEEEEFVAVGGATEVKLFGKWSFDDIEIRDISLVDYIAVKGDQAVDMSPFRRVNYALYLLATGAREASFRNLKTMSECLAEELINAARGSSNSYAIKKKDEIERVSKSNR